MNHFHVYNAGYPGDTTVELLARFDRDVSARHPDAVVLLAGSNDMFYPGHMLELPSYRHNMEKLLDKIEAWGAKVILLTAPRFLKNLLIENFPETMENPLSIDERFSKLNQTIRLLAAERSALLVDVCKLIAPVDESIESLILNPANSNRRDGMHLTAAGYGIIAQNVYDILQEFCPEARTIVCLGDSITYGVYMRGKGTASGDALTYPGQLSKLLESIR